MSNVLKDEEEEKKIVAKNQCSRLNYKSLKLIVHTELMSLSLGLGLVAGVKYMLNKFVLLRNKATEKYLSSVSILNIPFKGKIGILDLIINK